jgi:formamidopyrimidine-DNA glycosylase
MPELPEVETIKLGLSQKIIGLTLTDVEILNAKTFLGDPEDLVDTKVTNVWRRAKVLGIDLSNNYTILFHLKMTGQVIYIEQDSRVMGGHPTKDMTGDLPNKSTRAIFTFSNGSNLYFNDQRKFGWIKLIESSKIHDQVFLSSLGPEPLEKDFTWEILQERLMRRKNQPIKVALLDQTVLAGVGNIYACESCFDAQIDPGRIVSSLTEEEFIRLHQGVVDSLKAGIHHGGSSKSHYVNATGEKGSYLDFAYVYDREGDICKKCGTMIQKIKLGGRGTYFCPKCQR